MSVSPEEMNRFNEARDRMLHEALSTPVPGEVTVPVWKQINGFPGNLRAAFAEGQLQVWQSHGAKSVEGRYYDTIPSFTLSTDPTGVHFQTRPVEARIKLTEWGLSSLNVSDQSPWDDPMATVPVPALNIAYSHNTSITIPDGTMLASRISKMGGWMKDGNLGAYFIAQQDQYATDEHTETRQTVSEVTEMDNAIAYGLSPVVGPADKRDMVTAAREQQEAGYPVYVTDEDYAGRTAVVVMTFHDGALTPAKAIVDRDGRVLYYAHTQSVLTPSPEKKTLQQPLESITITYDEQGNLATSRVELYVVDDFGKLASRAQYVETLSYGYSPLALPGGGQFLARNVLAGMQEEDGLEEMVVPVTFEQYVIQARELNEVALQQLGYEVQEEAITGQQAVRRVVTDRYTGAQLVLTLVATDANAQYSLGPNNPPYSA